MQMGLGRLSLTPSSFWAMTLQELRMAAIGHGEAYEQRERMEWERARWQAVRLLMPNVKKGRKLQAQDLGVFPWEKPEDGVKLTRDELRARIEQRDGWLD